MKTKHKAYFVISSTLLTLGLFVWSASTPWIGWCPESNFQIAPNSRLPKWFNVPPGYVRKDLTVEIHYYVPPPPFKQNFKALLLGPPPDYRKLDKKIGYARLHPTMDQKKNEFGGFHPDAYPIIGIDTINGIAEIIVQRKPEPFLYVSDDPKLRKAIDALQ